MKNKYIRIFAVLLVAAVVPFLSGCWDILTLDQPSTANSGDKITTTMEVRIAGNDDNPHYGILGLLIPEDWDVDSVYYSGDFGPDVMSYLHPDSVDGDPGGQVDFWYDSLEVHYPSGPGMNWVVYQANTPYANPTGNPDTNYVDMTVEMTVGSKGGDFNLGYFVTNAAWDFSSEDYYADSLGNPIKVTAKDNDILLSEFVVTPTEGEFIEIHNPTDGTIDLSNYYLTDATYAGGNSYYYNIVTGAGYGGGSFGDFHARFPDGATIAAGEYQTVALAGDSAFFAMYGVLPTYEIGEDGAAGADVPDMREAVAGSVGGTQGGLSNGDEVIILYYWDGMSDLVKDVDYVLYDNGGSVPNEAVDKTGVQIDGPDGGTIPTTYSDDTPIANQDFAVSPGTGLSSQRVDMTEGTETKSGGNGLLGNDETSENSSVTWMTGNPTPNGAYVPGPIDVTFRLNTSTNLDTLGENHFAEIRGALNGKTGAVLPGGKTIDWNDASDLDLTNDGGDYWSVTFQMEPNDTLKYKFWTGFDATTGTSPDGGWEGPFNDSNGIAGDTRTFISGTRDSVLDIQYYHPAGPKVDQYWRPFEQKPDSVAIYFRVNLAGVTESGEFDPAVNGPVVVRGGAPVGNVGWDDAVAPVLTRETNSMIDGSFWSGAAYVDKDSVKAGDKQEYKFFIRNKGTVDWEGNGNRSFTFSDMVINGSMDTTLHWDWFNRQPYVGKKPVDANIVFRVSTEALEQLQFQNKLGTTKFFDRSLGDEIKVIGPKGWDVTAGLATDFIDMNFNALLQEWTAVEPFSLIPGQEINYKYFVRWDTSRADTNSANYIPNLIIRGVNDVELNRENEDTGWEEPGVTGGGNRKWVYTSDALQTLPGDFGFDRAFFNSIPANGIINTPISITWNIDMTDAANATTNPDNSEDLFDAGTDSVWIEFAGSLFAFSQGHKTFGDRVVLLTDPEGDMIYSGTLEVVPPAPFQLEFKVSYTSKTPGSYVLHGGGDQKGRRYYQYIHPVSLSDTQPWPTPTWPATYDLPVLKWTWKNLTVEDPPDLTKPTGVEEAETEIPLTFDLMQNYPNPFNPQTSIRFQVAELAQVKIHIFDLTGRLIKTLIDKKFNPGNFELIWRGDNELGESVSSGVYFLKMNAGSFSKTMKIALVR